MDIPGDVMTAAGIVAFVVGVLTELVKRSIRAAWSLSDEGAGLTARWCALLLGAIAGIVAGRIVGLDAWTGLAGGVLIALATQGLYDQGEGAKIAANLFGRAK